jgi:hypothetical protein
VKIRNKTAIIQLAGLGDIINILPIAKTLVELGEENPDIYVHPDKVSLFNRVSYATPVSTSRNMKPADLFQHLQKKYENVIIPQPCGEGITYQRRCSSFAKEAWDRCRRLSLWGHRRPVFDRRNVEIEEGLIQAHMPDNRPTVLVNLRGLSSPFPHSDWLMNDLRWRYHGEINFVDLATVKSPVIVDLLGLYGRANALISIDTGTLHLAAASCIPLAAFIVDTPTLWHGATIPRDIECVLRYSETKERIEDLHGFIEEYALCTIADWCCAHVYPGFFGKGDDLRRNDLAIQTWSEAHGTVKNMPVYDEQLPRLFEDSNGRKVPYVKDIIDFAFVRGNLGHIIFTNTDTCAAPRIMARIGIGHFGWGHRRDFKQLTRALTAEEVKTGEHYPGTDLFVIPRDWWKENRKKMPDMLIGSEAWDCVLRELMRETGGVEFKDLIYHERHDSVWERAENRYSLKSQRYALGLAKQFFAQRGINPAKFGIK